MAAQAQKHITHNEAIRALDALVQLSVLDRSLTAPPGSPANGDRYIVAAAATGAWAGSDGKVAAYQDNAWAFYAPREGWLTWVADEDAAFVWDGSAWIGLSAGGGGGASLNPASGGLVGINATADSTNRLSLSSAASLFNHAGAGHQLKINKSAAPDTASLLFQTAFSGRAEFGTAGNDDFHVKVSADGAAWKEALLIDRSSGAVSFPFSPAALVPTVYSSSATWTKPAGLKALRVTVIGAGGGGGGAQGTASQAAAGGGGGGGGAVVKFLLAADLGATEAITIGAGGTGGSSSGGNGTNGGTSSFGAHCSATGGSLGFGMLTGTATAFGFMGGGGLGSGGDLNLQGGAGTFGLRLSSSVVAGGGGGNTIFAGLGNGLGASANGRAGYPYGGGGGGARTNTATGYAGGDGADGVVMIEGIF